MSDIDWNDLPITIEGQIWYDIAKQLQAENEKLKKRNDKLVEFNGDMGDIMEGCQRCSKLLDALEEK